jgi:hypothetical protein
MNKSTKQKSFLKRYLGSAKATLLLFSLVFGVMRVQAQLSVTVTNPSNATPALAASYTTLADAVTALSASIAFSGQVILTCAGTSEVAPNGGYLIQFTGATTGTNNVIIDGASTTVTAAAAPTIGVRSDAIFKIIGSDYVTIRNFTMNENAANTTGGAIGVQRMTEFGVGIFAASATNGAQYNTIQNNIITLSTAGTKYQNAIGIFSSSASSATNTIQVASSIAGTNSFNMIYSNTITGVGTGIYFISPAQTATVFESGNDIGGTSSSTGNTITFGCSNTTADLGYTSYSGSVPSGVYFRNVVGNSVRYNTITNVSTLTLASGGISCINGSTPVLVPVYTSNFSNNNITITQTSTTAITGIEFGSGTTNGTITCNNNVITINHTVTATNSAADLGIRAAYLCASANVNGNKILLNENLNVTATVINSGTLGGITLPFSTVGTFTVSAISDTITITRATSVSSTFTGTFSGTLTGILASGSNTGATLATFQIGNSGAGNGNSIRFSETRGGAGTSVFSGTATYISLSGATNIANLYILNNTMGTTNAFKSYSNSTITGINHATTLLGGALNIANNTIYVDKSLSSASGTFVGISSFNSTATMPGGYTINTNTITFIGSALLLTGSATGISNVDGISATVNKTFYDNVITISGVMTSATGITFSYGLTNLVYNNTISINTNVSSTQGCTINGIISGGTSTTTANVYSNIFSALNVIGTSSGTITINGISVTGGSATTNIYNHNITNMSSGTGTGIATMIGISVSGGAAVATNVYKNKIYDLNLSNTNVASSIFPIRISGGTNVNVHNNLIGQTIALTGVNNPNAIIGINVTSTTATSNINLYYNTIYLSSTSTGTNFGASGIMHAASATATTAALSLRNNIIYNNILPTGSAISVAYRRTSTALNNYASTSNNNLLYCVSDEFTDGTNTDNFFGDYATRVGPTRDNVSFSAAHTFLNTSSPLTADYLKIDPATGVTQVESGAAAIAGYTDDYAAVNARLTYPLAAQVNGGGTGPDIGAQEMDLLPLDVRAPSVILTSLTSSCTTGDRTFTANITDGTGVTLDPASTLKPKVYYRKNSGGYSSNAGTLVSGTTTNSVWSFTILAADMGGINVNDTVYYFIATQDTMGTPNMGTYPTDGAVVLTDVNTITTPPAAPLSYLISNTLAGNYNVGSGQTYTTLTAAAAAYNVSCISGAVTFSLTDALYRNTLGETFPITFTNNATVNAANYLTIKPAAGVSPLIMSDSKTGFYLSGADYMVIDGSNNGTNSRDMTIFMDSFVINNSGILIGNPGSSPATNNRVKNCIVRGPSNRPLNATAQWSCGVGISGNTFTGSGASNDSNTISNNKIYNVFIGVAVKGTSAAGMVRGTIIEDNDIIDSIDYTGIEIQQCIQPIIRRNEIGASNSFSGYIAGIYLAQSTVDNALIYQNEIHKVNNFSVNGWYAYGIYLGAAFNSSVGHHVYNNLIYDMRTVNYSTSSTFNAQGIFVNASNMKIYNNTIRFYGTVSVGSVAGSSSCIYISSATWTGINLENNIFENKTEFGVAGSFAVAVHCYPATNFTAGGSCNRNIYFGANSTTNLFTTGTMMFNVATTTRLTTLAAIQSATSQDANSFVGSPLMNPVPSLKCDPSSVAKNAASVVSNPAITIDFESTARSGSTPSIGAYETFIDISGPTYSFTNLTNPSTLSNISVTGITITDPSGVDMTVGQEPRLYYKKQNEANTFVGNTSGDNGWKYVIPTNTTSPFNFTMDVSLLNTPLAVSDTLNYFFTAQDSLSNVSINQNAYTSASQASISALSAADFPIIGTTKQVQIVLAPLAGDYTVGATGDYVSIKAATSDLSLRGVSAAVNLKLQSNYSAASEGVFPIDINAISGTSSVNRVTIKPDASVTATISGSSANAIINLNGVDYLTIDGSNNGTTSRDLTITNTNTVLNTCAIKVTSLGTGLGAIRDSIMNLNLSAGSSIVVNYGIVIGGATIPSSGADNDYLTIQNNVITSIGGTGIYAYGTTGVTAGANDTLSIINNSITTNSTATTMGIVLGNGLGGIISGNTVDLLTTTFNQPTAISIETNFLNCVVEKNRITRASSTNTGGYGGRGITVGTTSATSNVTIRNNVVFGINGSNDPTFGNSSSMGIGVGVIGNSTSLTTVTGGVNIYNNSVNLYGAPITGTGIKLSAALWVGANATSLDIRNNIFKNTIYNAANATEYSYAVFCEATTNAPFTTMNYNDYYVDVANHGVHGSLGVNTYNVANVQVTLVDFQSIFGQNINSIIADPQYNSNTNLVPQFSSPVIAVGTPIAGLTTDYLGTSRNVTTPSMGAYENGGDAQAPNIIYTNITNQVFAGSTLVLNNFATITDTSAVDTVANKPRLYYKKKNDVNTYVGNTSGDNGWKYVETTSTANPFSFTMDYSLLNGGTYGTGDTLYYFVAAQDLAVPANVGIHPSTLATTATSTNLSAGNFPVIGTINQFVLVDAPLSGNYNVGAGQVAPNFATITAAISDMNLRGISSAVTFSLLDANYDASTGETFPISISPITGSSSVNTVTIKPSSGVTSSILTSTTTSLFKLLGARNFIIDGSNNGTNTRDLTLTNNFTASTGTASSVVWFASQGVGFGCNRDVVKNTILNNPYVRNGVSGSTYALFVGDNTNLSSSTAGIDNDTLSFINNKVMKANTALLIVGTAGANISDSLLIQDNDFGSDSLYGYGMWIQQVNTATIKGNLVHNVSGVALNPMGIFLSAGTINVDVLNNNINNINYTGTSGYGGKGITVSNGNAASNIKIANNVIYDIIGDGYTVSTAIDQICGINLATATGGISIYHNSINLYAQKAGYNGTTVSSDIQIQAAVVGPINIVNNVLVNSFDNTTVTTDVNAAVYNYAANTVIGTMDYNHYWVSGPQSFVGFQATTLATLGAFQTAFTQNTNSAFTNPNLNSNSILILQNGSSALASGTPLASVTTDYLGTTRSVTTPSRGAYEVGGDFAGPSFTFTALTKASTTSSRALTVSIVDIAGVPTSGVGLPMAYSKIGVNGTWSSSQGTHTSGSNYDFNIGGGTVINDTTFYYLVAQDVLGNVSANTVIGIGTLTANPPTAASAPTDALNYRTAPAVSGSYFVGDGQTYTTLTGAAGFFAFVNNGAVEANVDVQITSDITEPGTVELNNFGSVYSMNIAPQNSVVTTLRGSTLATHMIGINAANVTFDGNVSGSGKFLRMVVYNATASSCNAALRITNTTNFVCKNVIFEGNSTVNPLLNVFQSATSNYNATIKSCIFQDTLAAFPPSLGINSVSTTARGLTIGGFNVGDGNEFRNITTNAINLNGSADSVKVIGNSIYRTTTTATAPTYINYVGTAVGPVIIANNSIGGSDALRTGTALSIITTSSAAIMINVSAGRNALHEVYGNTISNISSVIGAASGINITGASRVNVYNNTFGGGATASDTIRNGGDNYGVGSSSTDSVRIYNNTIGNVAYYKATINRNAGIVVTGTGYYYINNNTIRDLKSNGTSTGVATITNNVGILSTATSLSGTTGMNVIKGNTIYNLTQTATGAVSYTNAGIQLGSSSNGVVDGNKIYGLTCNGSGVGVSAPGLYGISIFSTADWEVINNQISISNNSSSFIKAIEVNSTDTNVIYNNSIFVGGTSSVATNSYGIYKTGTSATNKLIVRNNLIYNGRVRTSPTSGNHYAIGTSSGSNLAGGLFVVDHNAYLDSNSVAAFDTAGACNYAGWVTKTGDTSNYYSTDVYPSTVFANTATGDLTHAMIIANDSGASVAADAFFGGAPLDYAGASRSLTPDIGALEFTPSTNSTLNLTLFLQGLYLGGSTMTAAPFNADGVSSSTVADTITVELHNPDGSLAYTVNDTLSTTGQASLIFPGSAVGNKYYIAIKHRNSVQTWSTDSILIGSTTSYDFSTAATQAYGDNMVDDGSGVFLIYGGDINQDESVDSGDYGDLDIGSTNGDIGYYATDLNGDSSVDSGDYSTLDTNSTLGIFSTHP